MAKEENVDMRFYDVIYNALKDIQDAMVGMMASTFEEKVLGRAEVRQTFVIPKIGTIAGCFITDGSVFRNQKVRLLRDGVILYDGRMSSLKRFKDDAKEVVKGYECGIGIENYNDVKVGDIIESYEIIEIKPKLS
jgi:translation initiation factor IF-2